MTDTQRRPVWGWQGWVALAGATLFAIVVVSFLLAAIADKAEANETGSISRSPAPETKWTTNQEWAMFNGDGETRCHIRYGSNNNRSIHNTTLEVRDDGQTVASLAIERSSGGNPADDVTIDNPGNVTLALVVDGDSSATVYAEWACDETPPPTTTISTTTTEPPATTTTTTEPPSVTTTTFQICAVSDCNVVDPPTTTVPTISPPTSSPTQPPTSTPTSTVPETTPIPTGVPTGEGVPDSGIPAWVYGLALVSVGGLGVLTWRATR